MESVFLIAYGEYRPSVLFVEDFGHSQIACRSSADDTLEACNSAYEVAAAEVADCEQEEKHRQGTENELEHFVAFESACKHEQREQSPHNQIPGHESVGSWFGPAQFGHDDKGHQSQPEQSVGSEGGGTECVTFLELHDPGDYLGYTAVENAHGEDHGTDGIKSCIVDIEQDSGHAESH